MAMAHDEEAGRAATTRQRHGEDFYSRIGQKSQELRRRVRAGDAAARALLESRRAARARRPVLWREIQEAHERVAFLREELHSRALADADPAVAALPRRFTYAAQLRRELAQAEATHARLRAEHRALLQALGLASNDEEV